MTESTLPFAAAEFVGRDGVLPGRRSRQDEATKKPPFAGDATDHEVAWTTGASFDALTDRSIRLHFWLEGAELYSFWFE